MARKKAISITIDEQTLRELKYAAHFYRVSRSMLIQMAISEYLERHQNDKKTQGVIDYGI